jgi:hypothetical protein
MHPQPGLTPARINPIGVCVVAALCLAPLAQAQASKTITATATVKTSGGVAATAPVTLLVDRMSTDTERDEILTALRKGGTEGVRNLLVTRSQLGSIKVGNVLTAVKYISERTTADGRLITALTGSPIAFVGAGVPGAKLKSGFDLGLVILVVAAAGAGHGELMPATKVRLDEQGAIVTDGYSDEVVRLSNVVEK